MRGIGDGQSRAIDLGDQVRGAPERHLRLPLEPDAQQLAQVIPLALTGRVQTLRQLHHTALRGQRISIPHLPQPVRGIAQGRTEIRQTIDLMARRLAEVPLDGRKVVAVNRAGTRCDRTRRSLGVIVFVDTNSLLRCDMGRGHFEEIELGRDLKQGPSMRGVGVQLLDIGHDFTDCEAAVQRPTRLDPGAQLG